jgi:pimeloyl-ACP methyl ester carboxylesterase
MSTFALVHGGAHGGWCWELVVPELERLGHSVVAPDLPFEDEEAGARAWADTVVDALEGEGDDVVVVGHSLGGMTVPVVASLRPVRRMVFLAAMVPVPGMVYLDYLATEPDAVTFSTATSLGQGELPEPGAAGVDWAAARDGFYQDCPEPVARRAWERLRPQSMTVFTERCPIDVWPDVPSTYILMTDDRAVNPAWSRRVAKDRIGADLIELGGGHSPFYSRPVELAQVLADL